MFAQIANAQTSHKYWIEFTDKGISIEDFTKGRVSYENTLKLLSQEAIKRRAKLVSLGDLEDIISLDDAPVSERYLSTLATYRSEPKNISRWGNAVSAYISNQQVDAVKKLKFVKSIHPVLRGLPMQTNQISSSLFLPQLFSNTLSLPEEPQAISIRAGYDTIIYHYGGSASQLERTNVRPLHAMGFDGNGVKLGVIDVGFRWKAMRTTKDRKIMSEYDFVNNDSVTSNEPNDVPDQDGHGSLVLSAAVGMLPDSVVGAAYNADIYLAKTEDLRSETPREEDNYAATLEWMEAMGVDITSTSLGYFTYDSGYQSITYPDLNGKTTISARATQRATALGVLVVSAMGNSGKTELPHLITPADADSIISVGAMGLNDTIADFSSKGPTSDGRIKPEICAPGVGVWTMNAGDAQQAAGGTSLATPLVSSACVLIKQSHPEASAQAIRAAVMKTGVRTGPIDTVYGYGRINAYNAALELGTIIGTYRQWRVDSVHTVAVGIAANNGIKSPHIVYALNADSVFAQKEMLPLSLAADSLIYSATFPLYPKGTHIRYYFETSDGADTLTRLPRNAPKTFFDFFVGDTMVNPPFAIRNVHAIDDIRLAPNPATDHFTITSSLGKSISYSLVDARGNEVLTFKTNAYAPTVIVRLGSLPSGAYFLRGFSDTRTLVIQRHIIVKR